jgi:hypothetical protein
VDAICSNIGPCCQEAGFPHDAAQCQSTAQNELRSFIDENRSPNVTYDADAARKCVDVYTATIRACRDPQRQVNAVCRFVFAGTLQPGQPCTSSQECVPGMSCSPSPDGGAKQCTGWPEVRGKLGDGCHATCTEAENGTSCGSGGSTGPGDAGAPGDAGMPGDAGAPGTATCYTNDGLYCDGAHACARQPALDQPCTFTTTCAGEAFCDNGVCVPKRTSGPCGELNDGCAVTAYCDLTTRQCALRKSIGDPCSSGAECAVTDTCAAGTCRERTIATRSLCNGNL